MEESPPQSPTDAPTDAVAAVEAASEPGLEHDVASQLPKYAHGLLKIRLPLRVTLASQRKSVQEITELGPGSIIKFAKTCDEPLELLVGDCRIAQGEVVKVGDKFGLRINGLVAR
jgi:flagellar motor switch protein FliN